MKPLALKIVSIVEVTNPLEHTRKTNKLQDTNP